MKTKLIFQAPIYFNYGISEQIGGSGYGVVKFNQDQGSSFGNGYDPNSGSFVAPINGIYLFSVQLTYYENSSSSFYGYIKLDDGTKLCAVATEYKSKYHTMSCSHVSALKKGQKVQFFIQYGYIRKQGNHEENQFHGVLLKPL